MVKISEEYRTKTLSALKDKGKDVTLDWNTVFLEKGNRKIQVKCNKHGTTSIKGLTNLRKGEYECEHCAWDTLSENIDKKGFTLLNRPSLTELEVSCNVCNTTRVTCFSSAYPTSRGIQCNSCLQNNYSELANQQGFDFIRKFTKGKQTRVLVQCRKDYTKKEVSVSQLMDGSIECTTCRTKKHTDMLSAKNCTLLDEVIKNHKGKNRMRVLYKTPSGEVLEVNSNDLLQNKFSTYSVENGWKRAITRKNCVFIEVVRDGENKPRITYKNQSGDVFSASSGNILEGKFATTKENYWYAEHCTYLIENTFGGVTHYKIGTANIPEQRLTDLKLIGESRVHTLESFPDRFGADKLESELHREFKQFKLSPTLASVFTAAIKNIRHVGKSERVPTKDGIHEWFTHEVYDILKTRYNLKEEDNGINGNPTNQVNYSG